MTLENVLDMDECKLKRQVPVLPHWSFFFYWSCSFLYANFNKLNISVLMFQLPVSRAVVAADLSKNMESKPQKYA